MTGIIFALGALLLWGFGDFFIQRSTRAVGVWKTLFFNDLFAVVVLTPFIVSDLGKATAGDFLLLGLLSIITAFAALFDFTALKEGKIAIVEPLLGIELPVTVGLSVLFAGEKLSLPELSLMGAVFVGIVLAVTIHHDHLHYHRRIFEKGVLLAGLGAIAMALMNVLVGLGSQRTSPLFTVWFFSVVLAIICGIYLFAKGEWKNFGSDLRQSGVIILKQAVVDNAAWVSYAFATTLIPIAIATTISESYIALAVLLGIFVNRERLARHQLVGVVLAIAGVIALSAITGG